MRQRKRTAKPVFRGLDFEQRACGRKKRFPNQREANDSAAYLAAAYPDQQRKSAYACEFCGGWHLATRRDE